MNDSWRYGKIAASRAVVRADAIDVLVEEGVLEQAPRRLGDQHGDPIALGLALDAGRQVHTVADGRIAEPLRRAENDLEVGDGEVAQSLALQQPFARGSEYGGERAEAALRDPGAGALGHGGGARVAVTDGQKGLEEAGYSPVPPVFQRA